MAWDLKRELLLGAGLVLILASCGGEERLSPLITATVGPSPLQSGLARCVVDLATTAPAVIIFGADAGDFLGDRFSLASGDFNGDNRDDLLIGAPLADGPDNSRENGGEAYVILGTASPPPTIDLAQGGAALTVYGEASGNNLGFTVAAGDVNGDGTDDILVGARFASTDVRGAVGKAYVIFGGTSLRSLVDTAADQQDVTVVGVDTGDLLTAALASGDVDADGFSDLILGAAGGSGPGEDRHSAGEVYVVRGSAQLRGLIDLAHSSPFVTIYGAAINDNLPNHLATGNLDGVGGDELLLGAPFADGGAGEENAGRAYIVSVPAAGDSLDLATGDDFITLIGGDTRDALGFFVSASDVNGDGIGDAIVGVRDADGPEDLRDNAGEAHILFGGSDRNSTIDLSDDSLDAVIYGADPSDSLGFTVGAGDLSGDGVSDVLVGSPTADSCENSRAEAGEVYIRFGGPNLPATSDFAQGQYDLAFFGMEPGDELGFSLASGDFNGDQIDDVFAGALLADGPDNARPDAGEVYVVLGARR